MRVHVAFTPDEQSPTPVGIVVDVLRATSTMPQALAAGYRRVLCCAEIDEARALAEQLPSEASRDYGQPFADIFKRFKGDFYAIDAMLFSPAHVIVSNLDRDRYHVQPMRISPDGQWIPGPERWPAGPCTAEELVTATPAPKSR